MRTNAFVRDLDVPDANAGDGRRLEVVVDGLPLFGGGQLAVDTTLVCALHGDGRPRRGAAEMKVALLAARRAKERRCPEFVGVLARARLVVFAVEVGGRFSKETNGFLTGLAKARGAKPHSSRGVLSRHGECDGLGCFGARLQKLWLHLFWCKDASALMGLLQRGMRWKGTSVMPALPCRQA